MMQHQALTCIFIFRTLLTTSYLHDFGGREEFKWHQLAHHQPMSQLRTSFNPHCTEKTNDKSTFHMKNGISDVAFASVPSEKIHLKKLMIMIIVIIVTQKPFTCK